MASLARIRLTSALVLAFALEGCNGDPSSMSAPLTSVREPTWTAYLAGAGSPDEYAKDIVSDTAGNSYVVAAVSSWGRGFSLLKFGPGGELLWTATRDDDLLSPIELKLGPGSLIYVIGAVTKMTGLARRSGAIGPATESNILVVAYRPDGSVAWESTHRPPGAERAQATRASFDASGDLFLTGYAFATFGATARWLASRIGPDGALRWSTLGPEGSTEEAVGIAPDDAGGAAVLARCLPYGADLRVIGLDSTGAVAWSFSDATRAGGIVSLGGGSYVVTSGTGMQLALSRRIGPTETWRVIYNDPEFNYISHVVTEVGPLGHVFVGANGSSSGQARGRVLEYSPAGQLVQLFKDDAGYLVAADVTTSGRPVVVGEAANGHPPFYVRALGASPTGAVLVPELPLFSAMAPRPGGGVTLAGWSRFGSTASEYKDQGALTIAFDAALGSLWSRQYDRAGAGPDEAQAVGVDATGTALVAGWSRSLGGDPDAVLAAWDRSGKPLWTRVWPLPGQQSVRDLWVGPGGDGLLLVTDGNGLSSGRPWAAVATRFAPDGTELWSTTLAGMPTALLPGSAGRFHLFIIDMDPASPTYNRPADVILSSTGQEISRTLLPFQVCNFMRNVVSHPGGGLVWASVECNTAGQVAVARLSEDGNLLWTASHDLGCEASLTDLALDSAGDLYLVGGSPEQSPSTSWNGLVTKLDGASGALEWTKTFGDNGPTESATAVRPHPDGGVVVAAIDDHPTLLMREIVVSRYGPDGNVVWTYRRDTGGLPFGPRMAADSQGQFFLAFEVQSSVSLGEGLVFALGRGGELLWEWQHEGPDARNERLSSIVFDPLYGLYLVGTARRAGTELDMVVARWASAPTIEVAPTALSLGDVPIGETLQGVITVANIGGQDLAVSSVALASGSDPAFSIVSTGGLPASLPPGGVADVVVELRPAAPGAVSATLVVQSADADQPSISVSLTGNGVWSQGSPPQQIADLLEAFDGAVEAGTLTGSGPGGSADGRLQALRNMLEAAGALIAAGDIADACSQLADALRRVDGDPRPPDFVQGPAAADIRQRIILLRTTLGCV